MALKTTNSRLVTVLSHLAGWICYFGLPFIFMRGDNNMHAFDLTKNHFLRGIMISNVLMVFFYYFNYHNLIPHILNKKKLLYYILSIVAVMTILLFLRNIIDELLIQWVGPQMHRRHGGPNIRAQLISYMMVFGVSTSIRLYNDRVKTEKQMKEKENQQLVSELAFLRSQISPHFMFNVLNSLVSLARKKSDNLESVILKLSNLLRYMLYDSGNDKVQIDKEIEYLHSYIDLQKLRFGESVDIKFDVSKQLSGYVIEPMLLIPFVENAFKHGIGYFEKPVIFISMEIVEDELYFVVKNKFNKLAEEAKDKDSGIGLANVKRRLSLLYNNEYKLEIKHLNLNGEENWFIVELKLKVK